MSEKILSVGIDIGTSTTQVIFSRITVRNEAGATFVPRIQIVKKELIYQSPMHFTPLISSMEIDADGVKEIVAEEYKKAGITAEELSTGAVIITGETARKNNAEEVVRALSGLAGNFVVATAGPDLESVLSGRGSGAAKYSKEYGTINVNLDIGGGTTNISVFENGIPIDTACFDIGGRLIKIDKNKKIVYIAPKIKALAVSIGIQLEEGDTIKEEQIEKICDRMAELIEEAVGFRNKTMWVSEMKTNHGLKIRDYRNAIFTFSGGVADCIYHPEKYVCGQFGDIGVALGKAIRKSIFFSYVKTIVPQETIRATVVGAGNHSMELSGSTITYTEDDFPQQDIPVIKVKLQSMDDVTDVPEKIRNQMRILKDGNEVENIAVAFEGFPNPDFYQVEQIADSICKGLQEEINNKKRLIIIVEVDFGKALGLAINRRVRGKSKIICIDNVHVEEGDYIDIGKPVANGRVLPVIVKTLIFM